MRPFAWTLLAISLLSGCQSSDSTPETHTHDPLLAHGCEMLGNQTKVQFQTNLGDFTVALYPTESPITVDNFIYYIEEHFFDDTLIHQVIPNFVLQAGVYDSEFNRKEALLPPIVNESYNHARNRRGSIAMMRYNHPDSATSEFIINLSDNETLDMPNGYAVFGQIIEGMNTIDTIAQSKICSDGPLEVGVPCEKIVIQSTMLETESCPS